MNDGTNCTGGVLWEPTAHCWLLWAPVGCSCGLRCFTVRTRVIVDVDNKTSRSRNFFVYTIKKWFLIRWFIYQKKTLSMLVSYFYFLCNYYAYFSWNLFGCRALKSAQIRKSRCFFLSDNSPMTTLQKIMALQANVVLLSFSTFSSILY